MPSISRSAEEAVPVVRNSCIQRTIIESRPGLYAMIGSRPGNDAAVRRRYSLIVYGHCHDLPPDGLACRRVHDNYVAPLVMSHNCLLGPILGIYRDQVGSPCSIPVMGVHISRQIKDGSFSYKWSRPEDLSITQIHGYHVVGVQVRPGPALCGEVRCRVAHRQIDDTLVHIYRPSCPGGRSAVQARILAFYPISYSQFGLPDDLARLLIKGSHSALLREPERWLISQSGSCNDVVLPD